MATKYVLMQENTILAKTVQFCINLMILSLGDQKGHLNLFTFVTHMHL